MKRLQIALALLGSLALIAGAFIVMTGFKSVTSVHSLETLKSDGVNYVGTNTCFTCHSDAHRDGSHALHPQIIQNPVSNPEAIIPHFSNSQAVRQVNTGGEIRAYTPEDVTSTPESAARQRYVMKTENGSSLLSGEWLTVVGSPLESQSPEWFESCAACHSGRFSTSALTADTSTIVCEDCHGPAGTHLQLARHLQPDAADDAVYAVRQAVVATSNPEFCGPCHSHVNHDQHDQVANRVSRVMLTSTVLNSDNNVNVRKQGTLLFQGAL